MSEDTKTPNKSFKVHVVNLVAGVVGGIACFGFVLLAHRAGLRLDGQLPGVGLSVQDGLLVGGALSMGVAIYGAKQLPGKGQ